MAKVINYTAEQTAFAIAEYTAGQSVAFIAEKLGKSVRSVTAKLSREGVLVKKTYKTKTGESVIHKDQLVAQIQNILQCNETALNGLEKVNKEGLRIILNALLA